MLRSFVACIALMTGCFAEQSYTCDDDQQCSVDNVQGTCEATSFCSFPDSVCPSSRRYSPFAGDGLARECVGDEDTTDTTADSTAGTFTSGVTTEQTSDDDTGCTTACSEGQWIWTLRDAELGAARGHGIAVVGDRVLVTGALELDAATTQAFVSSHAVATGTRDASHTIASDDASAATGWALAASDAGAYVVAGGEATGAGLRAFVARFEGTPEPTSEPTWLHRFDTLDDDEYRGVGMAADGRMIVAGRSGTDAIVHAFAADGSTLYARTIPPVAPVSAVDARAIAVATGGTAWIAGARTIGRQTSDVWALRLNAHGGAAPEFVEDDPASTPDVGRAIAGLVDGGFVVGGSVANEGWLARVAAETSQSARVLDDGEVHGVALAPDGSVIATGWTTEAARDVWLAGFTADLDPTPQWEIVVDHAQLDDEALAIAVGDDGIVYIAGVANDANGPALWLGAWQPATD